jgi:thioesterase domain-containing protein
VLNFVALARALGVDWSMYGIRARGIDDGLAPYASLDEMAAGYVDAVRTVHSRGPYAVGGFCLGGTVALEMARRLEAMGEAVSLLVLVDPRLPRPTDLRYRLWGLGHSLTLVPSRLREGSPPHSRASRILGRSRPDLEPSWMSETELVLARQREAHEPRRYLGPTVLILSEEHEQYGIPYWHVTRFVPNARTIRLPLAHRAMLQPPGVGELARGLRAALRLST